MKNDSTKVIIAVAACVIVAIICATVTGVTFIKSGNEQTTVQTTTEESVALKSNEEVKITTPFQYPIISSKGMAVDAPST